MKKWINKKTDNLFETILVLKNIKEARNFFRDLLTEEEILEFADRWEVAKMLSRNIPYREIEKRTGKSSTTIARIAKWLNSGMNGYKLLIKRLNQPLTVHHGKSSPLEKGLS